MDIEVKNSPGLSVGEPQSVPSRISMVLVEEAKASVTVCEDSHGSPCVGGTLSFSDLAGRLLPVVPAGIPFPVGPVLICLNMCRCRSTASEMYCLESSLSPIKIHVQYWFIKIHVLLRSTVAIQNIYIR